MRGGRVVSFLLVSAVAGSGVAAAGARSAAPAPGVREWGGVAVRSLDAPPADQPPLPGGVLPGSPPPPPPPPPQQQSPSPSSPPRKPAPRHRPRPRVPRPRVLSNERTLSRWAYVAYPGWIRTRPDVRARHITHMRWYTEDGFPEVYLLLREQWDKSGRAWVRLRVPMRPNGRVGWVPRDTLGAFHVTHQLIVVDRRRTRMYLLRNGRRRWSAPVGVGRPSMPTPAGHFWIRERFKILDSKSGYYPYAFGTADYSTLTDWPGGGVVGIHGPYYQPQMIPGHPSHGCIRLRVRDDAWLAQHITLGTPLLVR